MLPRSLSEEEFKKQTVQEYLQGEYGLDREQAEELANQEWSIRQDVENLAHVKKAKLKKKNDHAGFGKRGIVLHQNHIIKAGDQELRISTTAYKALRKKQFLQKKMLSGSCVVMMSFCQNAQKVLIFQTLSLDSEDLELGPFTNGLISFR